VLVIRSDGSKPGVPVVAQAGEAAIVWTSKTECLIGILPPKPTARDHPSPER
jgi:hypothetical protein